MSLRMSVQRTEDGRVSGYEFVGSRAERTQHLHVLAGALFGMVPTGVGSGTAEDIRRSMGALSLQIAALLTDDVGSRWRQYALDALAGIHTYLIARRGQRIRREGLSEDQANRLVVPGYAYFEYSWAELRRTLSESRA